MLRGTFEEVALKLTANSPDVRKAIDKLQESIASAWSLAVSSVNTHGIRADLGGETASLYDVLVTGDAVRAKLDSKTARDLYRKVVRLYHSDVNDRGSSTAALTMARHARNAYNLPVLYSLWTIKGGEIDEAKLQSMKAQAEGRLMRAQGIVRPIVAAYMSGNHDTARARLIAALSLAEKRHTQTIHNYLSSL